MDNQFKVSIYIRVSTDKQVEGDSLEEQESELKKFCEYKNYLIHKIHIERGRSAKDTNRAEYQKLLNDIKNKKINAVIVKKLDRLSRSLLDFEEFMSIAQEYNVEFISLKENFDTTNAIGKAMLRVALVFAQLEREQTAERISDVMGYRASQGLYNGGVPPFGYDVISKELIIHKQEKKIIEIMFDKFLETKSTSLTADMLNALGYKNRFGKLWDKKMLNRILRMPVYIGKTIWKNKLHQGIHQPIISEDVFNKVQNIFEQRKYHQDKTKIKGLLKGYLYCGCCGAQMTPNYTKKKQKKYYYYRCTSTFDPVNKNKCQNKYFNMGDVDKQIIKKILEYSKNNKLKLIEQQFNIYNEKIRNAISLTQIEIDGLENKLNTVKAKKEKYLDSLVANKYSEYERQTINAKIEEFTIEEKQLISSIYKMQFELSQKKENIISTGKFKEEILYFKINYKNLNDKELKEWFQKNIKRIFYSEDKLRIEFKLLDGIV